MNGLINNILLLLFLLSLCCCQKEKEDANLVSFDVGFEDLKNFQGVCHNNGEEEVYFYRARFNPLVKFYDLEGNLKDSLSLTEVESKIGRIGLFSTTSKDTMFVISYRNKVVAGIKKDASFIFKINLDSLSLLTVNNTYDYTGHFCPAPFYIGDNIFFTLSPNIRDDEYPSDSYKECIEYLYSRNIHDPLFCKLSLVYNHPKMQFAFRDYYYNKSHELKSYGMSRSKNYALLDNRLFTILAHDRNIYEIDVKTFNIIDTISIISQEYEIPLGVKLISDPKGPFAVDIAEKELEDKCFITNMLYSNSKKQYYIFLKTGKDYSDVDELGYPFKVYIYDDQFVKTGEHSFDNDLYNPKTAMMTSKGIMIEKTIKDQPYGKKTFEFFDL